MSGEMTRQRLQEALGLKHEDHFRKAYLIPALRSGLIEMTIPDKPRSSKQRYRLTAAGSEYLKQTEEKTVNVKDRHHQWRALLSVAGWMKERY